MEPFTAPNSESLTPPPTSSVAAPSWERAEALARYNEALIAPLVAELGEARQTIERQTGELGDLREERGRLSVGLVEMTVRLVEAKAERDAVESNRRRLVRLLTAAVAVLVILALVAGTLAAVAWVH